MIFTGLYSTSNGWCFLIPGKSSSVLFKSLLFFIDHLSLHGIEKALECFQTRSDDVNAHVFSPSEIQEYNRYSKKTAYFLGIHCLLVVKPE